MLLAEAVAKRRVAKNHATFPKLPQAGQGCPKKCGAPPQLALSTSTTGMTIAHRTDQNDDLLSVAQ